MNSNWLHKKNSLDDPNELRNPYDLRDLRDLDVPDSAALSVLLATARSTAAAPASDPDAEAEVLAAYRAARASRASGAGAARTRRRDDWRPRAARRRGLAVRATLGALLGGLTLGGAAIAVIGTPADDGGGRPEGPGVTRSAAPATPSAEPTPSPDHSHPETSASATPSPTTEPPRPADSGRATRDPGAPDLKALCRALEKAGGRSDALDAVAWERLRRAAGAAGGEGNGSGNGDGDVPTYCKTLLVDADPGEVLSTSPSVAGGAGGAQGVG